MNMPHENPQYPRPPGKEVLWEVIESSDGGRFIITSNEGRTKYHLYRWRSDGKPLKRLATTKSPAELQGKAL